MATSRYQSPELRRQVGSSPRPKTRETLCRNVLIYGHCRYEDQGCTFSHEQNKPGGNQTDMAKKSLNVESPSFTPATLPPGSKKPTFTPIAANAPSFTPRSVGAATPAGSESDAGVLNPAVIREFTPTYDISQPSVSGGAQQDGTVSYDPFSSSMSQGMAPTQFNPYADDHAGIAGPGTSFFTGAGTFSAPQPLQHHLYFPAGTRKDDLLPFQRLTHDFFMPEALRVELAKKQEAAAQVMPNSQLPQMDNYHSLVPLDTTHKKNANVFGYPSWVYKAFATKSGHLYCLRRLEGYRLSNEQAIKSVKDWRKIDCANVVSVIDAFTTRAFGDSSLVFVQNYFSASKTLAETHLLPNANQGGRFAAKAPIPEALLWTYITQIANALKAIHAVDLAARCIDPSKIILTGKNRIQLSACSILDVVHFDDRRSVAELQQEDFVQFGKTILGLATNIAPAFLTNLKASLEQVNRIYSAEFRDTLVWLLTPPQPPAQKGIDEFIRGISGHLMQTLDQSLHANDELESVATQEMENGRIARLVMKLSTINERQDFGREQNWSENGERYLLKLFRDYLFHQVDSSGNPVLDIGHMVRCLTKLDVGTEERICLVSRDEQTSFIVSYKELKKQLGTSFGELLKASKQKAAGF